MFLPLFRSTPHFSCFARSTNHTSTTVLTVNSTDTQSPLGLLDLFPNTQHVSSSFRPQTLDAGKKKGITKRSSKEATPAR